MPPAVLQREGGRQLVGPHDVAERDRVRDLAEHPGDRVDGGHEQELPQLQVAGHHGGDQGAGGDHAHEVAADQQRPETQPVHRRTGGQPGHRTDPEGHQPDEARLRR